MRLLVKKIGRLHLSDGWVILNENFNRFDMGVSRTYVGNYSEYLLPKAAWIEAQYAAWEKQQKEIDHTKDLITRLGAGANSGRATSAEKVCLYATSLNEVVCNRFVAQVTCCPTL